MSRQERYGVRELVYSRWHRELPDSVTYIDIDGVEYCDRCKRILALIEIARDVGQEFKPTTIMRRLATRHKDEPAAYLVFYTPSNGSVGKVRMRRVAPLFGEWLEMSAEQLGAFLIALHEDHVCQ